MAKNNALLKRLQTDGATDTPTPGSSNTTPPCEEVDAGSQTPERPAPALKELKVRMVPLLVPDTTPDPQRVWSELLLTPQGRQLTDSRIHSLSPQRFDTVFLELLKAAFLAGWDARKGVDQ